MKRNLKDETLAVLAANSKGPDDVVAVIGIGCQIDRDKFWELADTDYEAGYGLQQVACDLMVVGNGWWLSRNQYDGKEWWDYNVCPSTDNLPFIDVHTLTSKTGGALAYLNSTPLEFDY